MIVRSKEYFPLNSCSDLFGVLIILIIGYFWSFGECKDDRCITCVTELSGKKKKTQEKTRNKHFYEVRCTRTTFYSLIKRL